MIEQNNSTAMGLKPIRISTEDHRKLTKLVNELARDQGQRLNPLEKLKQELARAVILDAPDIPPDVVTLHSRVTLRDLESGELEEWTLTYPEHANLELGQLSVLAPVGTAILGFGEGDEIEWETPGGMRRLKLEKVSPGNPVLPKTQPSLYG